MSKKIQYLVIHCTATPEGREVTKEEIMQWHTLPKPKGRGWKQVGYTDIVHLDGRVENLVKNNNDDIVDGFEITNGVTNMNSVCRHIVYVGGLAKDGKTPKDTRTGNQKIAMGNFVREFNRKFPHVTIVGHNHFAAKACPSFDVAEWLKIIRVNQ